MSQQADEQTATVTVRNLGGIDTCEVTFRPGVTVLAGIDPAEIPHGDGRGLFVSLL